jgi:hypothetical protein
MSAHASDHHHHSSEMPRLRPEEVVFARIVSPSFSLLRISGMQRLAIAGALVLVIWAGVIWALQ